MVNIYLCKKGGREKNLVIASTLFFVLCLFIFRPVSITLEEKCEVVVATVTGIFEGGENDIVFTLKDMKGWFYVNCGLESGMNLDDLQYRLVGFANRLYSKIGCKKMPYSGHSVNAGILFNVLQ